MKEINMSDVGQRIYKHRKKLRLSQDELAEKADISKQTVSVIEGGNRDILASNIARIAGALEVSTDYLLFGARTDDDLVQLDRRILSLTDGQYEFLEVVVNSFVELCGRSE